MLYRINRIKYSRREGLEQGQERGREPNKTTPDKSKGRHHGNKVSMLSTVAVEEGGQGEKKRTIKLLSQPRNLKISQRVATNPKESNLVPSEKDYAVSVQDEKEKESPYLDEFENLLYEEEGEEKQLALNDSFEEFEKKERSEKEVEIMRELARRKEKESEEKRQLDTLKDRIKDLVNEEKEWINKNLKLKTDIKRLKQQEPSDQNREIEDIKLKIAELRLQEQALIEELSEIKRNNCIEVLVCGEPPASCSQSQRAKDKALFHSINNLPLPLPATFNPLTTSVRSNTGAPKFLLPSEPATTLPFKPSRPPFINPQHQMGFPCVPTQSFIQPTFPATQIKPVQVGPTSNDHTAYQTRPMQLQGGRIGVNVHNLGGKKPSVPTFANKN